MVIKLNFVKHFQKQKIKATIRYNSHRRGRDGEKMSRQNFGWDRELENDEIYQMIDAAPKGTNFFRFKINPDPKTENPAKNLDLRDLTIKFMLKLEELKGRKIQFIAAVHNQFDHTDRPHIHAVVLLKGKITRKNLQDLRQAGRALALKQQKRFTMVQRGVRRIQLLRDFKRYQWGRRYRPSNIQTCLECKATQSRFAYRCFACGKPLHEGYARQEREVRLAW